MLKRGGWLVVLCLTALAALDQAKQLPVKTYTTADGLPRDRVSCIVPDSHGFLWFCTAEGLSRFDGYRFTNYGVENGLPHRIVNDLIETRDGVYIAATVNGLAWFGPHETFAAFRPSDEGKARVTNVLLQDRKGAVWCGTNGGLYRVEDVQRGHLTFQFIDLGMPQDSWDDTVVTALLEDRQGVLWIGAGSGLYRRDLDGRVKRYTTRSGLPNDYVFALLEDRGGRIWAGTFNGLCRLAPRAPENRRIVEGLYTKADGLASSWIVTLFQAASGTLWVGTSAGLNELSPDISEKRHRFRTYRLREGVEERGITALAEDRDGNLWIGAWAGAQKIVRGGFVTYTKADGVGRTNIRSVLEDRSGRLYAISDWPSGIKIHRLDNRGFNTIRPAYPPEIDYFGWGTGQIALVDRDGAWWIATGRGLCRFPPVARIEQLAHVRPKAVYTTRDGLASNDIFRIFEDSRGDVWISAISKFRNGVSRWIRATGSLQHYSGFESRFATAFREDRSGNLWIGTTEGVVRYGGGQFQRFGGPDGAPSERVSAVHLDHAGRLWIAWSEGLTRVDHPSVEQPRFLTYTRRDELSSRSVQCITEDLQGRIYVGTGRGVDRFDPDGGQWKHYTTADGLVSGEFHTAYRDAHGALWFGTERGLSELVPEPDRIPTPPAVFVTGVRVGGRPSATPDLDATSVSGLTLHPGQNELQIDFVAPGFAPGGSLVYQYKLEGTDYDWSAPLDRRSVNYADLPPGNYRFVVRAVTLDGVVSPRPAEVTFRVLPPVWGRWWFQAAVLLLCLCGAYAFHRSRVTRLVALERLRTRIATDLHDDIGSSLSQIAILSEVAQQRIDHVNQGVLQPLSEIASLSRELVDSMSDIVWAINPARDRPADLARRMRRFASELLEARNIRIEFRGPAEDHHVVLDSRTRREVFLIFKESIHNILRHSGCTQVEIELTLTAKELLLLVRDNGRGFIPAESYEGSGLPSMRSRAESIGGSLELSSGREGASLRLLVHRS